MVEILVALFLAFTVMWTLITYAGESKRWGAWPVFLIFFFSIFAGGLWWTPVGPPLVGVYWVPFLFVAIFIALFRASVPPPTRRKRHRRAQQLASDIQNDTPTVPVGLGVLFWLLLVGLAMVALFRYAVSVDLVPQAS